MYAHIMMSVIMCQYIRFDVLATGYVFPSVSVVSYVIAVPGDHTCEFIQMKYFLSSSHATKQSISSLIFIKKDTIKRHLASLRKQQNIFTWPVKPKPIQSLNHRKTHGLK